MELSYTIQDCLRSWLIPSYFLNYEVYLYNILDTHSLKSHLFNFIWTNKPFLSSIIYLFFSLSLLSPFPTVRNKIWRFTFKDALVQFRSRNFRKLSSLLTNAWLCPLPRGGEGGGGRGRGRGRAVGYPSPLFSPPPSSLSLPSSLPLFPSSPLTHTLDLSVFMSSVPQDPRLDLRSPRPPTCPSFFFPSLTPQQAKESNKTARLQAWCPWDRWIVKQCQQTLSDLSWCYILISHGVKITTVIQRGLKLRCEELSQGEKALCGPPLTASASSVSFNVVNRRFDGVLSVDIGWCTIYLLTYQPLIRYSRTLACYILSKLTANRVRLIVDKSPDHPGHLA